MAKALKRIMTLEYDAPAKSNKEQQLKFIDAALQGDFYHPSLDFGALTGVKVLSIKKVAGAGPKRRQVTFTYDLPKGSDDGDQAMFVNHVLCLHGFDHPELPFDCLENTAVQSITKVKVA